MSHEEEQIMNGQLKIIVTITMISLLMLPSHTFAQPCGGYEITAIIQTDECPPFGFPGMVPNGLNEDGWMVGSFRACVIGPNIAWLWTPEGGLQLIPMPDGTSDSRALAISGSKIVGHYDNSELELGRTGFLYDCETDEFTSLGTLPGGDSSDAQSINGKVEIVGFWGNTVMGPSPLAYIWRDGKMIDINPDFGTPESNARDINSNGIVTGWMGSSPLTDARAFIWVDGKVTSLPPIPGGFTSESRAINDLRQVVGRGVVKNEVVILVRAFLWENDVFTDLGTLPGLDSCAAIDINNSSTVIGECGQSDIPNSNQPYVWNEGIMINLNDLIPEGADLTIREASAINNSGQIAAQAVDQSNDIVAVLLTPIQVVQGDLDNDCQVGVSDLLVLFSNWGLCPNCLKCPADLNQDCTVSVIDLLILFANWG